MIIELKNAIKTAILAKSPDMNFYFEELKPKAHYPYCFFYIPSYNLESFSGFNDLNILCAIEYKKQENDTNADLWAFAETLQEALMPYFNFLDGKLHPNIAQFRIVDNVLQMEFNLNFMSRKYDIIEFMNELDLTINNGYNVHYTEEV